MVPLPQPRECQGYRPVPPRLGTGSLRMRFFYAFVSIIDVIVLIKTSTVCN